MLYSTRSKLVFSLISVALAVAGISFAAGWSLLYKSVLNEAFNRVRQDLNVARLIYDDRVGTIRISLETAARADDLTSALATGNATLPMDRIRQLAQRLDLDFSGILIPEDRIYTCTGFKNQPKPGKSDLPIAWQALAGKKTVSGTAASGSNLVAGAAVPVMAGGRVTAVIFGGMVLNQDKTIVDKIGDTVFRNEIYRGRNVGTATIFFNDLRISTSVLMKDGSRAVGTRASKEVSRQVLEKGDNWTDRALVVNDWYITAYEPITDIFGKRVGMLYVGVLEAKYRDVRNKTIWVFSAVILAGLVLAIAAGTFLADRIMQPVNHLLRASMEISAGNLSPDIGPVSPGDIGLLQKAFMSMSHALFQRNQAQLEERRRELIRSEKQASIGKLAAGVAHEINNPLTPVLTFTHLILARKDLPDQVRKDLEVIAFQTERVRKIVKGLLDFSRQPKLDRETFEPDPMLADTVELMKNQALLKGVHLFYSGNASLPRVRMDKNQIQSVVVNLVLNAMDATPSGGRVEVSARPKNSEQEQGIEIQVRDTGSGISPENINKLFEPFFTTKPAGEGTGLGLAVSFGIVERHNGKIRVESTPGQGSVFFIWLPCNCPGPENKEAR